MTEYTNAVAVTPSDTVGFEEAKGIYVGVTGNVAIIPSGGKVAVTLIGAIAGEIIPISCTRVNNTNTTATDIVALY